jgi:hypothetical protein
VGARSRASSASVLLIPAARYAAAEDPRRGGAWRSDVEEPGAPAWRSVELALDDVRAVVAAHPIDRARVVAVGDEDGRAGRVRHGLPSPAGCSAPSILVDGAVHREAERAARR